MTRNIVFAVLTALLATLLSCGAGTGGTTIVPPTGQTQDPPDNGSDVAIVELSVRVYDRDSYEDDAVFRDIYNAAISIKWSDNEGDHTESKISSRDATIFNVPGGNTPLEVRVSASGYDPHLETLRLNTEKFSKQVGLKRNVNSIDPDQLVINVTIPSVNVFPEQLVIDANTVEFNVENLSITGVGTLEIDGSIQLGDFLLQNPVITTQGTIEVEPWGGVVVNGTGMVITASQGVDLNTGAVYVDDLEIEISGQTELEIDNVNCSAGCIDADDLTVDANGVVIVCDSAIQPCP